MFGLVGGDCPLGTEKEKKCAMAQTSLDETRNGSLNCACCCRSDITEEYKTVVIVVHTALSGWGSWRGGLGLLAATLASSAILCS